MPSIYIHSIDIDKSDYKLSVYNIQNNTFDVTTLGKCKSFQRRNEVLYLKSNVLKQQPIQCELELLGQYIYPKVIDSFALANDINIHHICISAKHDIIYFVDTKDKLWFWDYIDGKTKQISLYSKRSITTDKLWISDNEDYLFYHTKTKELIQETWILDVKTANKKIKYQSLDSDTLPNLYYTSSGLYHLLTDIEYSTLLYYPNPSDCTKSVIVAICQYMKVTSVLDNIVIYYNNTNAFLNVDIIKKCNTFIIIPNVPIINIQPYSNTNCSTPQQTKIVKYISEIKSVVCIDVLGTITIYDANMHHIKTQIKSFPCLNPSIYYNE